MPKLRLPIAFALTIAVLPLGTSALATPPAAMPVSQASSVAPIAAHVAKAAQRFAIPEDWIWAVMRVESGGNPRAISSAGAMGLMQIMPATWKMLRARYGLGDDVYNAQANIMAGAAYLREMHDRYGNPAAMLAAYNAGPGRYDDYLMRGRPLPAETVAYMTKLAPMIGGGAVSQRVATATPDPRAWKRSALFAMRAEDMPAVPDQASDRQSDDRSSVRHPIDAVVPATRRDSLFVTVSRWTQP